MRKTVKLELKNCDNAKVVVDLRLTIEGQFALKKKYKENDGAQLIMSAVSDVEMMVDILNHALNHRGNTNTITDAEELYDMLVDNDIQGSDGFARLLIQVGEASGFFTASQAEKIIDYITKNVNKVYEEMEFEELLESVEEDIEEDRFQKS